MNMMQQSNKDTLARIPVGTVYGPYHDGNFYVLAKKWARNNGQTAPKCAIS
jgi:hypothetical protein